MTSLIRTTACTNLQHVCQYVCVWNTAQKINYKYVYSSTSVGFSGPSVVSPPESLAASLSQARGFIPSTTCQHSYQAVRLEVKLSTSDGIDLRYHPLHERPKINICFLKKNLPPSLVSFFSLLFFSVATAPPSVSTCTALIRLLYISSPIYSVKCTHPQALKKVQSGEGSSKSQQLWRHQGTFRQGDVHQ